MDTKTGTIYTSYLEGERAILNELRRQGVSAAKAREEAAVRLVTGARPTLRKLQKMIRAQIKREAERR